MATRDWVELHKTIDPNIFDGGVEFQTEDLAPEYPPNGRVSALETTSRVDGPFEHRQYVRNSNSWQDAPPQPAPPPPTSEEIKLTALIADDAAVEAAMDTLLAKTPSSWTDTDRSSSQRMTLRKVEIARLQHKMGK